ncbi:MAG: hypothetical protein IKU90_08160, partial [Clostridia bacterium]|nr:hypothetical protein [Clostridia bacterium]
FSAGHLIHREGGPPFALSCHRVVLCRNHRLLRGLLVATDFASRKRRTVAFSLCSSDEISRDEDAGKVVRPRFRMGLKPAALLRQAAKVRLAFGSLRMTRDGMLWSRGDGVGQGRRPWSGMALVGDGFSRGTCPSAPARVSS